MSRACTGAAIERENAAMVLIDDLTWLLSQERLDLPGMARRLRYTPENLTNALRQAGRLDLLGRLAANRAHGPSPAARKQVQS